MRKPLFDMILNPVLPEELPVIIPKILPGDSDISQTVPPELDSRKGKNTAAELIFNLPTVSKIQIVQHIISCRDILHPPLSFL